MLECVNVNTLEMMRISGIKMEDIAKRAGVSLATVGRVIHKNGYVSEEKRREIEQIIQETGYVPNKIAQGLKNSRSKLIGHMTLFNQNMLFEQISRAVDTCAYAKGYYVLTLASHGDREEEKRQVEELIGHQVDGVIITSNSFITPSVIEKFTLAGIPVVMIERTQNLPGVDCVGVDDFNGAYEAVTHILNKGHQRIGFLGMNNWHEVEKLRYEGYCTALTDRGISADPSRIYMADTYSVEEGVKGIEKLLYENNGITALFMTSDIYACGVMQYCYRKGIRVPEELSLIGYDNTLSAILAPPISSMGLPCEEIGRLAMDFLIKRITAGSIASGKALIKPVVVDRGTVKEI